ncbi:MAG: TrkH family potassium uptake protein [Phycisphaerales bacterium]|nr:TrkH family potassium uptake protein [Phycisphaerae bacterium]NNF44838.1 TrkH family potassium uptake protein [Phycisphaerales bacterium]NNM24437.1 TrkH family potassium uptake protein [Phycisphaerales bacterium]
MNFRLVGKQLALLMVVLSGLLGTLSAWSFAQWRWFDGGLAEREACIALCVAAASGLLTGAVLWLATRRCPGYLGRREALLLVALSWLLGAALAGLPYYVWATNHFESDVTHPMHRFVDCYFEAMSGLTTTGATILSQIGELPRSLLLWRSLTHWLGGLGIVVLFVAVLPSLGAGGKRLFRVEAPGPVQEGVRPQVRDTARLLWFIYLGLTVVCGLSYRLSGMSWFDSVCHAFSVISTGGLSTRDASIGFYDSLPIDIVTMVFMTVAGVNFAIFYQMTQGRFRQAWRDTELRVYLLTKVLVIALVTWAILGQTITLTTGATTGPGVGPSLRHGAFTTIALHTGTGFGTTDYDGWPYASLALLLGLMFIGGCAGSTAGGVKVIRFWIALKVMVGEIERAFRPNVVRPLKVGKTVVDDELKIGAIAYMLIMLLLVGIGAGVLPLLEPPESPCDFATACTASVSSICNVGPGLGGVGPTRNYGWMSPASKIFLSILMVLGRLEMFALLVLFAPTFWRKH